MLTIAPPCALQPPSPQMIAELNRANDVIRSFPQTEILTEHLFCGGMYARTIRLAPGKVMMGSQVKLATILIVHGSCSMTSGDECIELTGYNVIPGAAGRKHLFYTRSEVEMTMIFSTRTVNVQEAEDEVFAEADQLMSRTGENIVVVTGE